MASHLQLGPVLITMLTVAVLGALLTRREMMKRRQRRHRASQRDPRTTVNIVNFVR
jgi:hypothetical protein